MTYGLKQGARDRGLVHGSQTGMRVNPSNVPGSHQDPSQLDTAAEKRTEQSKEGRDQNPRPMGGSPKEEGGSMQMMQGRNSSKGEIPSVSSSLRLEHL